MNPCRFVLDTNVLVSALRSNRGASFQLLRRIEHPQLQVVLSVPLAMEYESVLLRPGMTSLDEAAVGDVLDFLFQIARPVDIQFLWRPLLPDPKDDMVLELAFNANADCIVTHNISDFQGAHSPGVRVLRPRDFLLEQKLWVH